jgi:hypothetical protein
MLMVVLRAALLRGGQGKGDIPLRPRGEKVLKEGIENVSGIQSAGAGTLAVGRLLTGISHRCTSAFSNSHTSIAAERRVVV